MEKKKIGILVASILSAILIFIFISIVFSDSFFNKSEARKMLNSNNINLNDDFEIIKNESFVDRNSYHQFELKISIKDKERLIQEIKNSNGFQDSVKPSYNLQNEMQRKNSSKIYSNFKSGSDFIRQSYEKEEKYSSLFSIITINTKENHLIFQEIMN